MADKPLEHWSQNARFRIVLRIAAKQSVEARTNRITPARAAEFAELIQFVLIQDGEFLEANRDKFAGFLGDRDA